MGAAVGGLVLKRSSGLVCTPEGCPAVVRVLVTEYPGAKISGPNKLLAAF